MSYHGMIAYQIDERDYDRFDWHHYEHDGNYYISIVGDTSGYTYNAAELYEVAIGTSITHVSGAHPHDAFEWLTLLATSLENNAQLHEWTPPNGCGDYHGALAYVHELRSLCKSFLHNDDPRIVMLVT